MVLDGLNHLTSSLKAWLLVGGVTGVVMLGAFSSAPLN